MKRHFFASPLRWVLLTGFTSSLLWAMIVPLWQFPDEQAHFAQVQNYAEIGGSPAKDADLSYEIFESEKIMGTDRDQRGNNKYTYHPEYRIKYTNTFSGGQEDYLKQLDPNTRTAYVKAESPRYAPLFYIASAIGYRLASSGSLLDRVWATRFISVLMFVGIVYVSHLFSKQLFPASRNMQLATSIAIAFHPMLTFVSAGINNDTLNTLLSTLLLFLSLKLLSTKPTPKIIFVGIITFALGALTKQLIYLILPTFIVAFIYSSVKHKISWLTSIKLVGVGVVAASLLLLLKKNEGFWLPYWPKVETLDWLQLLTITKLKIAQLYRETFAWYWGVFKWLSVVLPLTTLRIIKIVIGISFVGWIKAFTIRKEWQQVEWRKWLLLLFANSMYIGALMSWDIMATARAGFSHGIQGRYFFPLIVTHMVFLVYGWHLFLPQKFRTLLPFITAFGFIMLNLSALHRVIDNYYTFTPLTQFVRELSQYKPVIAKWPYVLIFPVAYTSSVLMLVKAIWKEKNT